MASLVPNSFWHDICVGAVIPSSDSFKVQLLTSTATPNKDTWTKRSDVTNEVSGTGYTAGGASVTVTVPAVDTTNDRQDITWGQASWASSTITARYAVYYKSRGGAASADELCFVNDFGADVSSTANTFTLNASTTRIQN